MNIDSLSKLIEASDISSFRTLSLMFLDIIGFSSVHFCDGPYDGGKDFKIYENENKNIKLAIQISTEKDWRKKIEQEVRKIQKNYGINIIIFVSSRRIPENTFQSVYKEILLKTGAIVSRYDNQSISSEFIKNNQVSSLLKILGIENFFSEQKKEFSPKHEAISSILIFGEDTKRYRDAIFDSLLKSYLSAYKDGISRDKLVDIVINDTSLSSTQAKLVNSHIDRLFQQGVIVKKDNLLIIKKEEYDKFQGLKEAGREDYNIAKNELTKFLKRENIKLTKDELEFFLENLTEFIISLYASQVMYLNKEIINNESYLIIKEILGKHTENINIDSLFENIAEIISKTTYGTRISSTALYLSIMNTNSDHLLEALGGRSGAWIFLDASVAIPMICGLLYDKFTYRYGYSANLLYNLIKIHKFTTLIPDVFVEEVATHLIEACRDYAYILELGEDLSYSGNAFISHYSRYKNETGDKSVSFKEYVDLFRVNLDIIKHGMPDHEFYRTREESKRQISMLLSRYGIETISTENKLSKDIKNNYYSLLETQGIRRPEVVLFHDAKAISLISSSWISPGAVKILCTWDKSHFLFRSSYNYGYEVLNPISIIDLFSIARPKEHNYNLSALSDFAMMQNMKHAEQASVLWDELVNIEKNNFSDAELLIKAKKFKDHFLSKHTKELDLSTDEIATAWDAWKKLMK